MFYRYTIEVTPDCLDGNIVSGIVYAGETFASAVEAISEYYGEEDLIDIKLLRPLGNGEVIEVDKVFLGMIDSIEENFPW